MFITPAKIEFIALSLSKRVRFNSLLIIKALHPHSIRMKYATLINLIIIVVFLFAHH